MLLRKNSWVVCAFLLAGCGGGGFEEIIEQEQEATRKAINQLKFVKNATTADGVLAPLGEIFEKIGESRQKFLKLSKSQIDKLDKSPEMQQLSKVRDQLDEAMIEACKRAPDREEELKDVFKKTGRTFQPRK